MKSTFIIKPEEENIRIDIICTKRFPQISRSRWTKHGIFELEQIPKKSKTKTKNKQSWTVSCQEETILSEDIKPWNFSLKILAESKTWVVIEKPIGIAVHPSLSNTSHETIINALVHQFGKDLSENFDEIEGRNIPRPGLVHRLDKPTSGLLLVAKTNATHRYFQNNWNNVKKFYDAIVSGNTPKKGKIDAAIFRDPTDRKKMSISRHHKAKSAISLFETIESNNNLSHLSVQILTGRTHQIRVHLSSIGFPILGDILYGGIKDKRIFLHAHKLKFPNPDDKGKMIEVLSETPEIFLEKF
jgi:23S rRNA pseudouridine1911/1915/1917 synthase